MAKNGRIWLPEEMGDNPEKWKAVLVTKTIDNYENSVLFRRSFSTSTKCRRVVALVLKFLKNRIHQKLGPENQLKLEWNTPEVVLVSDT